MRRILTALILSAFGLMPSQVGAEPALEPVADFALKDLSGNDWSFHRQKNKATVFVFLSCDCPMSNGYLKPLSDLAAKFKDKGVAIVGINANKDETVEQLQAHAKEFKIAFPILKDDNHAAVKALGAKVNPEAIVVDEQFVTRYRGRIDDGYMARLKPRAGVVRLDLDIALGELLAGKPVTIPRTVAYGCAIQEAQKKAVANAKVTYHKDVEPILQAQCQSCHRQGNIGPFPLMCYRHAVKWADDIVGETQARRMPPWKPERNGLIANERLLTDPQLKTLADWVEQGSVEGDPKDAPPPVKFPEGWSLGKPDLVLEMSSDVVVAPTGRDLFHCVVFPTNLPEDVHIAAIEVQPGNARVVHHAVLIADTEGRGRRLQERAQEKQKPDEPDRGPGYSVFMGVGFIPSPSNGLGGWAPGLIPKPLPEGIGHRLAKGSDIVMQIHYHRTGKEERDRTRIGLYFTKGEVKSHFVGIGVPGLFLRIPPNRKNFKIDSAIRLTEDVTMHWMAPHMHLLGKDIALTAKYPDGKEQSLIKIDAWDYNWQEMYQLKEPMKLPKGTILRLKATYDNSADNPLNPNSPPKAVFIGEQTHNEMCFVFIGVSSSKPGWLKFSFTGTER
jgi:peroxiredoxin